MGEVAAAIAIEAAEPGAAHAARVDMVDAAGGRVDEMTSGIGHGRECSAGWFPLTREISDEPPGDLRPNGTAISLTWMS